MPAPDLSLAQRIDVKCPACAAPFPSDRVVVADLQARPDLQRSTDAGTLHASVCPRCGRQCRFDGAALLLNRSATPHFVFVCVSAAAPGNHHDVVALFTALKSIHPSLVLDRWTAGKVLSVEHRFLPYLQRPWVRPGTGEWIAPLQLHLLVFLQVDKADRQQVSDAVTLFPDLVSVRAEDALERLEALARERGDDATAGAAFTGRSMLQLIRLVNQ